MRRRAGQPRRGEAGWGSAEPREALRGRVEARRCQAKQPPRAVVLQSLHEPVVADEKRAGIAVEQPATLPLRQQPTLDEPFGDPCRGGIVARRRWLARRLAGMLAGGFGQPDVHQLSADIPLIGGLGNVQTFVTLQPDEWSLDQRRQGFGQLRLANACFALEKQRPAQLQAEKERSAQSAIGHIAERRQAILKCVNG